MTGAEPAGKPPTGDSALKSAFAFTVSRPVATTMIVLTIATFGFISFKKIPLELLPPISYPSVTVRTEYPGAGPEDIEERVTKRVEEALAILPGLVSHSSTSRPGVSDVLLEFNWDKALTVATQEVRERLDRANLPSDVKSPLILRYDPSLDPVLRIAIYGDRDLADLRVAADEIVARGLATVNGVAAVKIRGGLETEIRVRLDNQKLSRLNLDISEVDRKLKIENVNLASGKLVEGDTEYLVRTLNEFQEIDDILDLGIAQRNGQPVRIREVATVLRTSKERDVITRADGRESVELLVYREADANIVQLAKDVRLRLLGKEEDRKWLAAIEAGTEPDPEVELRKAMLAAESTADSTTPATRSSDTEAKRTESQDTPEIRRWRDLVARKRASLEVLAAKLPADLEARVLSDQSVFIENAIEEVNGSALLGGALSILVLLLFLKEMSTTSIISISIPLSVIATFACMFSAGTTLNIMSLGGLALGIGMLVDNSIVVLESIVRCREEGDDRMRGAMRGTSEVGSAVVSSTLTTVAVFFPIAFISGIAGQIFKDQALTVVFSLTSSLFVALYFVPMLAARVGGDQASRRRSLKEALATPRQFLGRVGRPLIAIPELLAIRALRTKWTNSHGNRRFLLAPLLPLDIVQAVFEWIGRLLLLITSILIYGAIALLAGVVRIGAFLAKPLTLTFDLLYGALARAYPPALRFALGGRGRMVLIIVLAGVAAWLATLPLPHLGSEMLPTVHQGELIVNLEFPVGTPVETTAQRALPIEQRIAKIPGVVTLSTSVGVARDEVAPVEEGSHTAKLLLRLATSTTSAPAAERAALEEQVIDAVREIVSKNAELSGFGFSRPTLFSIKSPLEVEARGNDLEELRLSATDLASRLSTLPGLSDVRSTVSRGNPEVRLTLDREKMLRFGLDMEAISNRIRAQVQGVVSTRFAEGERRIDVRVKSDVESLESLLNLTVNRGRAVDLADTLDRGSEGGGGNSGSGSTRSSDRTFFPGISVDLGSSEPIPLSQIAEVKIVEGPSEIRRINGQRAAVVSANTSGFDVGRALESMRGVLSAIEIDHPGITCSIGGQGAEMGSALAEMKAAMLLAIFLVYIVMAAQFESILQPLVIMMAIPLAFVGTVFAMWLTNTPMSVVALIGAVVLAGIVVNNAIVLLDYSNQLRARGYSVVDALVESGRARLRPILMTTGTTVLGLIPLTGVLERIPGITSLPAVLWAGSELQAPLAITVIGGLTMSTVLTLVVIPAIWALIESLRGRSLAGASEITVASAPTSRETSEPPKVD